MGRLVHQVEPSRQSEISISLRNVLAAIPKLLPVTSILLCQRWHIPNYQHIFGVFVLGSGAKVETSRLNMATIYHDVLVVHVRITSVYSDRNTLISQKSYCRAAGRKGQEGSVPSIFLSIFLNLARLREGWDVLSACSIPAPPMIDSIILLVVCYLFALSDPVCLIGSSENL